ncbi:MAG: prohibitin family protein [Verrucomicrobia bacterium]|nr:prohibitin family protein [Verrucomicrobiota bacterium]
MFAVSSMTPRTRNLLLAAGALAALALVSVGQATFVVQPGYRGVRVTLGKVASQYEPEGFGWKLPFISRVEQVLVRQQTEELETICYSSDLQQVKARLRVLYRVPPESVVTIFRDYEGEPFASLIAPRVYEAFKETAATRSAERIVQEREQVKNHTLASCREKVGKLLAIEDLVIENLSLSPELEAAIERKMVQEQEAIKARFTQEKTQIEADTAVIKAKGEAQAIDLQGEVLGRNPAYLEYETVERWNGEMPWAVSGSARSAAVLLPLRSFQKAASERSSAEQSGGAP